MRWRLYRERLYDLRKSRGWSQEDAAEECGLSDKRQYIRLENGESLRPWRRTLLALAEGFGVAPEELILRSSPEELLRCQYERAKKTDEAPAPNPGGISHGRRGLVAMDVDGTILRGFEFSWQVIWSYLGYDDEDRRRAMQAYLRGDLSYEAWCRHCAEAFIAKNLRRSDFDVMLTDAHLVTGFHEVIAILKKAGFRLAIISGGVDTFLEVLLPAYEEIFDVIFINRLKFTRRGSLKEVVPTKFDFAGKLVALEELRKTFRIAKEDTFFIGEGLNDEAMASIAGKSIAFNPSSQRVAQSFDVVVFDDDFRAVLPHLGFQVGKGTCLSR